MLIDEQEERLAAEWLLGFHAAFKDIPSPAEIPVEEIDDWDDYIEDIDQAQKMADGYPVNTHYRAAVYSRVQNMKKVD